MADEQRSLALGVQSVFFRLFGTIPGPIAFGAIIDSGCIYWQYECNRRGNCWVYDNRVLSYRAFAVVVSGLTLNMISRALSWIFYPGYFILDILSSHELQCKQKSTCNKGRW